MQKMAALSSKLVERCTLPLTGVNVVDRIITDLGVFDVTEKGLELVKKHRDISFEEIQKRSSAKIINCL